MKKNILLFFFSLSFFMVSAQSGVSMFDNSSVHSIRMYTSFPYFWDTMTARYNASIDFMGSGGPLGDNDPVLFDSIIIDGTKIDSCGVKQKGYYSNWGADSSLKKPLKIEFNEYISGQRYDGLRDLNLANSFQDPTMMHDHLSLKILRDFGITASRTSYANVYINGTLWSLYVLIEQVGPTFLDEHFGDNNGNLYKVIESDLKYLGTDDSLYKLEFEKKTNSSADDWSDLKNLTMKINTTAADSIANYINLDIFLKTLAVDVSLNNWDSYFEHGRNFYLYNDIGTNKFQWIPWDYNLAFAATDYQILLPDSRSRKPLINKCFNSPFWKQKYFGYLCELNNTILTLDHLESFIDDTKSLIAPSVLNDPNNFYTYPQFNASISTTVKIPLEVFPGFWDTTYIEGLKPFILDKHVFILDQLALEFYSCIDTFNVGIEQPTNTYTKNYMFLVMPNPTAHYVQFMTTDGPITNALLTIYSVDGTLVRKENIQSNIIDVSTLHNGMYMIQLFIDNNLFTGKIIVQH